MPTAVKQQVPTYILLAVCAITLLLLSALNIQNFLAPREVLGIETEESVDEEFWREFLVEHPNYIPGWIELGEWDKVKQIDPNYLLP